MKFCKFSDRAGLLVVDRTFFGLKLGVQNLLASGPVIVAFEPWF